MLLSEGQMSDFKGAALMLSGIGVMAFSFFIAKVAEIAFYPVLGAGFLAVIVGAGLIVGARSLAAADVREHSSSQT